MPPSAVCLLWLGRAGAPRSLALPALPKPYVMYPLKVSETITVYFTLGCYGHSNNLLYSCTSTWLVAVTGRGRLVCQGQFAALHSDWQLAMALTSPGQAAACTTCTRQWSAAAAAWRRRTLGAEATHRRDAGRLRPPTTTLTLP